LIDEFDDVFSIDVTWGSLASKHHCPWHYIFTLLGRQLFDSQVSVDNIENVHKLPFVFVDALDLDIKHRVLVDSHSTMMMHPLCQLPFVIQFDRVPFYLKILVISIVLQISQPSHIHNPLIGFQIFSVEIRQQRIRTHYPSSGCDSICDVDKFIGEKFIEIFE
jgi:hypothetical protein